MFSKMFNFFIENKLISSNQSGFKSLMRYINLLMWDLKLEASSLKYEKYLIKCGMMVPCKN